VNEPKRYGRYPQLERLVRAMSDEGRELVAHWNLVLLRALEGYVPKAREQAREALADQPDLNAAAKASAVHGVGIGLAGWATIMREIGEIIVDPSEADWCCKRGMLAHPNPCPQHDFDARVLYDEGTVIEREYGEGTEKAVCVNGDTGLTQHWRSVRFALEYTTAEVGEGRWKVVGRV
jgi:hypothetical protein